MFASQSRNFSLEIFFSVRNFAKKVSSNSFGRCLFCIKFFAKVFSEEYIIFVYSCCWLGHTLFDLFFKFFHPS